MVHCSYGSSMKVVEIIVKGTQGEPNILFLFSVALPDERCPARRRNGFLD